MVTNMSSHKTKEQEISADLLLLKFQLASLSSIRSIVYWNPWQSSSKDI